MRLIVLLPASILMSLSAGCARVPAGSGGSGTQIIVSMTVSGQINPSDFYFVLFNATNAPLQSQGPIPVVAPPWGNGFAAGQFTGFVRVDGTQPNGGYGVYSVVPNSNLQTFQYLGTPTTFTPSTGGVSTLQFTIPLSQLATTSLSASQITALQINFINTDRIPVDPNDPNPKDWDALGDARISTQINDPITISVLQSGTYQNSSSATPEPEGDVMQSANGGMVNVSNPDLDIVNWSVQVQQ